MSERLFLSIDPLPDPVRAALTEMTEFVEVNNALDNFLESRGEEVKIISSRGKRRIDAALLSRLPALELIAGYGVGYDKVDVREAVSRGITVTHTPDILNEDVADLAVALLLATVRKVPRAERFLREGRWLEGAFPLTSTLRERKIGMVGMGRIGQAIARRLDAFDLEIAYHTRRKVAGVPYGHVDSLVDLARQSDVLIVIVPGGAITQNLIDERVLAALGSRGILVNVSRGSVVDQDALLRALQAGTIEAAGLDVYPNEPHVPEALIALENAVLLPHIGSATHHTRSAMNMLYLDNVSAWLKGAAVPTPVPECRSGQRVRA